MRGPFARVVGALAVLLLYHGVLLRHPPAEDLAPGSAALDRTLVASRDAFVAEQFEDALAPTLALVEALPGQPVFLERLALVYQGLDRHGDEAGAWEAFVDASATPIDACPMLAEAYRRTGDEAAALDAYERCLAFDPKNVDMLLYLGQAYLRAGRHDAARRALEQGRGYAKQYADFYLVLGVLDFAEGRTGSAREQFEHFLELAPQRRSEVSVWLERTGSQG
jgi:tetratricopeptide (TPR) repeat protein